jgi:pilus assembly protein CpaE
VLTLDAPEPEWREAIARARGRLASGRGAAGGTLTAEPDDGGRLITVFSSKGGSGKSLVASNLAILLAQVTEEPVTLVDLDLQSGDLAIMLQLMPALSIYDAAQSATRLDVDALSGHLTPHRSGVSLLAAPMEPSLADQVDGSAVAQILGLLKGSTPLTIVDGPSSFTDQLLAAIDQSDLIILVGSMDVPSIKNLRLAMNTLGQLGIPREQLKIVLNRADSKVGLRSVDVEKSLGTQIDVMIPSSRDVPLSINQGAPLAVSRPRSPVVGAIRELIPAVVAQANKSGGRRRRRG